MIPVASGTQAVVDGNPKVFTTGPTALHPIVSDEAARAIADGFLSESHRSLRFRREVGRCSEALRALLGVPPDHRILFTSSASEAMERIVEGVVRHRSAHLVNGAFARRFREIALNLGREASAIEVADGDGYSADLEIPAAELLALTQNETSTGARIAPETVHALATRMHRAGGGGASGGAGRGLVAVDLVSGWPIEEVDPARIDAGFFSVQKAFGLPAGLGVIVASPALVDRSRERQAAGESVGGYLHLPALADAADRNQTVATPNMLGIRLLGRVAEAYLERGIATLRAETDQKARVLWEAVEALPGLRPFVEDRAHRSRTILVIEVEPDGERGGTKGEGTRADRLRGALLERGFIVSDGYGPWKGRHLRVANFPVQTPAMIEELAGALRTLC